MNRLFYPFFSVLVALFAASYNGPATANSQHPTPNSQFTIVAPASISTGEPAPISISAPALPDGTTVTLTAVGSYGIRAYRTAVQNGRADVTLPPTHTRHSGQVTMMAGTGPHRSEVVLTILPGPASGVIPAWITEHSIPADGSSQTMVVALPLDEWGNPVAADTPVTVKSQHPDRTQPSSIITGTAHLLAWTHLKSSTVAGQTWAAVSAGLAHSLQLSFVEIPDQPIPFSLTTDQPTLTADGHRLVRVATTPLKDLHGNAPLDGTSLTFLITDVDGARRTIPAVTVAGRAELFLQAPAQPGSVMVQAQMAGSLSEPISLKFTAGPVMSPITASTKLTAGAVVIKAGPLVGALGQLVVDGTPVQVDITGPLAARQSLSVETKNGYATVSLRRSTLAPGHYIADIQAGTGQVHLTFEVR